MHYHQRFWILDGEKSGDDEANNMVTGEVPVKKQPGLFHWCVLQYVFFSVKSKRGKSFWILSFVNFSHKTMLKIDHVLHEPCHYI